MSKTVSKKMSKKAVEPVQEVLQVVEEVVAAPVDTEVLPSEEDLHDQKYNALLESMKVFSKTVRDTMNNFQLELRLLMLQAKKLRKRSSKRSRGNKTPNGFTKTVQVSKEMLQFCGRPVDTESMSRNDVNQFLHKYIRDNNLQDPENKRQIVPDEALKTILDLSKLRTKEEMQANLREKASEKGWSKEQLDVELSKVTENEHVNYFNLQRLVNHHYL